MSTGLLVSVRSAAEAEAALAGGADLIDVKEPAHGPLGFAGWDVIAEVARVVAGRAPLSAALGELADWDTEMTHGVYPCGLPLSFVKWGLSRCGGCADWPEQLRSVGARIERPQTVAVAYADWRRAESPEPLAVAEEAGERFGAFLIDTWGKDGSSLLDWQDERALAQLIGKCRAGGTKVALAGSLGTGQIERLKYLAPDWFAVRGAACIGGRSGTVDAEKVRRLVEIIRNASAKRR